MVSTRKMSTAGHSNIGGAANGTSAFENAASMAGQRLSVASVNNPVGSHSRPEPVASTSTHVMRSYRSHMDAPSVSDSAIVASSPKQADTPIKPMHLFDLPVEMIEEILSYCGYKKVAQMREISKRMDTICSALLNLTFTKLYSYLLNRVRIIKKSMPRRESSRRNHPMSYECDVMDTCYMRMSLLQMTFGKHMHRKMICFFPGAIIDEVYLILARLKKARGMRPHSLTEELYDLSTMAMEYFKEHLEPQLPPLMPPCVFPPKSARYVVVSKGVNGSPVITRLADNLKDNRQEYDDPPPQSNMVLRKGIRKIKQGMKLYNNQLSVLRTDLRYCRRKASDQQKLITEMQKLIEEQQKQFAARLNENEKKNEEMSMKISALLRESNKCKIQLQYLRQNGRVQAPVDDVQLDGDDDIVAEEPQHDNDLLSLPPVANYPPEQRRIGISAHANESSFKSGVKRKADVDPEVSNKSPAKLISSIRHSGSAVNSLESSNDRGEQPRSETIADVSVQPGSDSVKKARRVPWNTRGQNQHLISKNSKHKNCNISSANGGNQSCDLFTMPECVGHHIQTTVVNPFAGGANDLTAGNVFSLAVGSKHGRSK